MKYCWHKKLYYVCTGKFKRIRGGFRNFEICKTYAHALKVYHNSKVRVRQIDLREYRKPAIAIRWGRK